jgi:hypothetical protein
MDDNPMPFRAWLGRSSLTSASILDKRIANWSTRQLFQQVNHRLTESRSALF